MIKNYVLISDGSSDKVLLKIIDWAFSKYSNLDVNGKRADFYFAKNKLKSLSDKIQFIIENYDELDFIVIHRDAEREDYDQRLSEVNKELKKINHFSLPKIPVIPVRMTEAWLLFDAKAIANAAGNPKNFNIVSLPKANQIESKPDPKTFLEGLIKKSSGLKTRGLKKLNTRHCIQLIPDFMDDFTLLEQLPSFQKFKQAIEANFGSN